MGLEDRMLLEKDDVISLQSIQQTAVYPEVTADRRM